MRHVGAMSSEVKRGRQIARTVVTGGCETSPVGAGMKQNLLKKRQVPLTMGPSSKLGKFLYL